MTKLSPNFDLAEFCQSNTAARLGIDMTPSPTIISNLGMLVTRILDPLRTHLGKPIHITSGYRPPALNSAIGGARSSQHVQGQAADIHVDGMTVKEVCEAIIAARLPFDQLIHEFGSWTHVSYNPSGIERGEILTAKHVPGTGTVYTTGLPA